MYLIETGHSGTSQVQFLLVVNGLPHKRWETPAITWISQPEPSAYAPSGTRERFRARCFADLSRTFPEHPRNLPGTHPKRALEFLISGTHSTLLLVRTTALRFLCAVLDVLANFYLISPVSRVSSSGKHVSGTKLEMSIMYQNDAKCTDKVEECQWKKWYRDGIVPIKLSTLTSTPEGTCFSSFLPG